MKKEEKIKLEIKKLEKERNELLILFVGIFILFLTTIINTANILITLLTGIITFFLWYIYTSKKGKKQSKINGLYEELGIK